ncbi:MAG: putative bifunctional diguanylate cyclase/phosphodiesterase [Acidimicrobiales bacterium]
MAQPEHTGRTSTHRPTGWLSPYLLSYLMGPPALVTILLLNRFHLVAARPWWIWLTIFVVIPSFSLGLDEFSRRWRRHWVTHARVAIHVAAVTTVIYLTGWGAVLIGAFAFVAIQHVSEDGADAWRRAAGWSVMGIAVGQVGIWQRWFPSFLSDARAQALAVMSTFVLVFVIRMAGATVAQKEVAEESLAQRELRFRSLVQHASDATLVVGPERTITYASPAIKALVHREPDDVVGTGDLSLIHPDDREFARSQLRDRLARGSTDEPVVFRMVRPDGSARHVEAVITDLRQQPSVGGFVINARDITERKLAEDLLAHQALHDPLTGLPNRTLILDRAQQMLSRARRDHQPLVILFIDLDNFKDINDTLGHEAGDRVLQAVGDRLSGVTRASDTVGRLGGDEFVVLAETVGGVADPDQLAERIHFALHEPFRVRGYEAAALRVTASIGIAAGERSSAHELLRAADIALYRSKASGKNCTSSFVADMEVELLDNLEMRRDLQSALSAGEFFLVYQPVFDLHSVTMQGVEALLRWRHPTRGVVNPDTFVPLLEETGLIVDVGRWVLDEACRQVASWQTAGHRIDVSVNMSVRQLQSDAIVTHVADALRASGLPAQWLMIEITETALMLDPERAVARLQALRDLGVQLAIDDFGTGYSSLAHLRQFPVDRMKIDRSFISGINGSSEADALVHMLVELGRTLGLETLAEGIEEPQQLELLRSQSCGLGQGFLFSRPVDATAITAMLRDLQRFPSASVVAGAD